LILVELIERERAAVLGPFVVEVENTCLRSAVRMRVILATQDDPRCVRGVVQDQAGHSVRLDEVDALDIELREVRYARRPMPGVCGDRQQQDSEQ
jgi:hypothetical protein